MNDTYDIHILEPEIVYFSRGTGGVLKGVVEGKLYEELIVFRAFPFLYPTQYISIRDSKGEELGIIQDIWQLDEESGKELERELQFRYFLPRVTRIESVKNKTDLWIWELQTGLGRTRLSMPNLHEYMLFPGGGRIILRDVSGKRCEIEDWRTLDSHSRMQLTDVI
ncbi:hypothetical protein VN24_06580 [Paenibacillus beijingensis]|uniref:DUF1854 domain-containing protein n=2 Tax=Paenibacillus beijingensis TaxID=1126833 RepID=A0A0D5NRM6_9BACL|nr:hypothetical protein VN24_06580 [Paenibacillus beijingensis]